MLEAVAASWDLYSSKRSLEKNQFFLN